MHRPAPREGRVAQLFGPWALEAGRDKAGQPASLLLVAFTSDLHATFNIAKIRLIILFGSHESDNSCDKGDRVVCYPVNTRPDATKPPSHEHKHPQRHPAKINL